MFGAMLGGAMLEKAADHAYGAWSARYANRFTEKMSNTRYQRAVKDMRAAGLNPILAATQGGVSGAGAQGAQPKGGASSVVSTAMAAKRLEADVENIEEDTGLKRTSQHLMAEQAAKVSLEQANTAKAYEVLSEEAKQAKMATARLRRITNVDATDFGESMRIIDRIVGALSPFARSVRDLK